MPKRKPLAPVKPQPGYEVVLQTHFLEDLVYWASFDSKVSVRLVKLMAEIKRTPFEGTGKPERLKHLGANIWSRRLTNADRVVYEVKDNMIHFLQARYHYG